MRQDGGNFELFTGKDLLAFGACTPQAPRDHNGGVLLVKYIR